MSAPFTVQGQCSVLLSLVYPLPCGLSHISASAARKPTISPPLAIPVQRTAQIHQAAAFRIGGQTVIQLAPYFGTQGVVGLKRLHVGLGETATDENAIDRRQMRIFHGIEKDQLCPFRLKRFQIIRIIVGKCGIAGDADAQPLFWFPRWRRFSLFCCRRQGGNLNHPVDVDTPGNRVGNPGKLCLGLADFGRCRQPQMPFADSQFRIAAYRTNTSISV